MEMFPRAKFSTYLTVNVPLFSQGNSRNSEKKIEVGFCGIIHIICLDILV